MVEYLGRVVFLILVNYVFLSVFEISFVVVFVSGNVINFFVNSVLFIVLFVVLEYVRLFGYRFLVVCNVRSCGISVRGRVRGWLNFSGLYNFY